MEPGRPKAELKLTESERGELECLARGERGGKLALRARVVLECARGRTNKDVARELAVGKGMVCRWRQRFVSRRLDGLIDLPRSGAPRRIGDDVVERVVGLAHDTDEGGRRRFSARQIAAMLGISHATVYRIWQAHDLTPAPLPRAAPSDATAGEPTAPDWARGRYTPPTSIAG